MIMQSAVVAASFWLALNIFLLIWLGWQAVKIRRGEKISLGDGGSEAMLRAMRMHANHAEYAPLFFIGLFALAQLHTSIYVVHALGGVFTLARYAHGFNFYNPGGGRPNGRFFGTLFTWVSSIAMVIALLWKVFLG